VLEKEAIDLEEGDLSPLLAAYDAAGALSRARREHDLQMRSLVLDILEIADSLDRLSGGSAAATSIEQLRVQLGDALRRHGI
jgi:hypothetical protein